MRALSGTFLDSALHTPSAWLMGICVPSPVINHHHEYKSFQRVLCVFLGNHGTPAPAAAVRSEGVLWTVFPLTSCFH